MLLLLLQVDRHKYVRVAFHGSRMLSSDERKDTYHATFSDMPTFTGSQFVNMDTLFSIVSGT